jgi:hypothetical protein
MSGRQAQTQAQRVERRHARYRYLEQTAYQVNISDLRRRFPEVAWTSFTDWTQQRITAR